MKPRSSFLKQFNKLSLGTRVLCLVLLCGIFFAFTETFIQLYLDYKADVSLIDTQIQQIEKSYLKSITKSTWNLEADAVTLQLEGTSSKRC